MKDKFERIARTALAVCYPKELGSKRGPLHLIRGHAAKQAMLDKCLKKLTEKKS